MDVTHLWQSLNKGQQKAYRRVSRRRCMFRWYYRKRTYRDPEITTEWINNPNNVLPLNTELVCRQADFKPNNSIVIRVNAVIDKVIHDDTDERLILMHAHENATFSNLTKLWFQELINYGFNVFVLDFYHTTLLHKLEICRINFDDWMTRPRMTNHHYRSHERKRNRGQNKYYERYIQLVLYDEPGNLNRLMHRIEQIHILLDLPRDVTDIVLQYSWEYAFRDMIVSGKRVD